jgi:type IV pilus assembly protein PilM
MERYPVAWGLDIGHASIKAAKLARIGEAVEVQAYAMESITVPEGGDRDKAVAKALEQMALREEFGSTPVIAALSGRQVFSKSLNIPIINPRTIHRMVELEAKQQIPGDFASVEWAYHMSPAADGSSCDITLLAVKREVVADLIAKTRAAGLNLVGVSVSALALANFVRYDQTFPPAETVIVLDVGAENTDLVFYKGEQVALRALSISGNDITKAFQKKFRLNTQEEAEKLKREVGDERQAERVIKVIEGALGELTSEVQRHIGFYKSQNAGCVLENLVISGSSFRLSGLPEYLAERMRFTVNILQDLDRIQVAKGLEREHFLDDLQSLGVAMGLALQGVGAAPAAINLMPQQQRVERILASKRWAGVAIAAMLVATAYTTHTVTAGVIADNLATSLEIDRYIGENRRYESETRTILGQVAPKAKLLAHFGPYGEQAGVTLAAIDGVRQAVQALATEYGPVGDGSRRNEDGGDPALQAIYLESVELAPFNPDAGPFAPLAAERMVTVVVRIPASPKQKEISRRIEEHLQAVPVPAWLGPYHPAGAAEGARLFAAPVQYTNDRTGSESFHFLDPNHIDPATGDTKPVVEERQVPVLIITFSCRIPARSGT